jgi:hypothetical protein
VGEKYRVFHSPRRIGRFDTSAELAKLAFVGSKRRNQARLRAGADDEHFLLRAQAID